MATVNIQEAQTQLTRLLERVEAGEEVTIERAGKPIAKLVPLRSRPRRPGGLKGKIRVRDDFEAPLPGAIAAQFRDEPR